MRPGEITFEEPVGRPFPEAAHGDEPRLPRRPAAPRARQVESERASPVDVTRTLRLRQADPNRSSRWRGDGLARGNDHAYRTAYRSARSAGFADRRRGANRHLLCVIALGTEQLGTDRASAAAGTRRAAHYLAQHSSPTARRRTARSEREPTTRAPLNRLVLASTASARTAESSLDRSSLTDDACIPPSHTRALSHAKLRSSSVADPIRTAAARRERHARRNARQPLAPTCLGRLAVTPAAWRATIACCSRWTVRSSLCREPVLHLSG